MDISAATSDVLKERPILFSGPMVRAILDGTKTQTRRVVKPQPDSRPGMDCTRLIFKNRKGEPLLDEALEAPEPVLYRSLCPYGQPGDRLWVRETWRVWGGREYEYQRDLSQVMYRSTHEEDGFPLTWESYTWRPSIFMSRWASRITLEITSVRVERLNSISEADAKAEGADCLVFDNCDAKDREFLDMPLMENGNPYRNGYALLWESINGDGSWDANPYVWVIEFRRIKP